MAKAMLRFLPALLMLCCSAGYAATVYKTVDKNGVVGYSDTPPPGEVPMEVLQIDPAAPQSPEEHLARLAAMREATDRMVADRQERERHRAELREINAKIQSYQVPEPPVYTPYTEYYPVYTAPYWHAGRPPLRPGSGARPTHPIVHPPLRPGHGILGSSNSQLMRPITSSRR